MTLRGSCGEQNPHCKQVSCFRIDGGVSLYREHGTKVIISARRPLQGGSEIYKKQRTDQRTTVSADEIVELVKEFKDLREGAQDIREGKIELIDGAELSGVDHIVCATG